MALQEAEKATLLQEVPVGAVIVDQAGCIIATGHNQPISSTDPSSHAEIVAIRNASSALQNYRLNDLTLYVTLEPCTMCAGAISHARIGRVVYGAGDSKGGAVDNGVRFFEQATCHHRPEVTAGILAEEAATLLKGFFKERRKAAASKSE